MKKSMTFAILVAFVTLGGVVFGTLAPSFTEKLRVFSLVMVPVAIAGSLLVLYFDWRAKLLRPVLGEREPRQKLDTAA
jgi:hypothetical protein